VNGQRGHLRKLVGRALFSLVTTAVVTGLLAPVAAASPIGDAEAAIMAAWDKAGGDTSPLGARKGDVYPVGDGFALEFAGGKMYYTTETGAKYVYGPILDKYESLGGAAGSDLGFPIASEVPGLAGQDSRVATFSASDKPVIFWTADHGAFVVRGPLSAAWDKLGNSGGVLGVPVGDETYDGDVVSQKFSNGAVSWNRKTKQFTAEPAGLVGDQLKGLDVTLDATGAINMAWRSAGGANGPLGAKQGGQYPMGGDGVAQDFVGGKVFYSPATGANAVESNILTKYESLGGPVNSDLGFPIANESDGGFGTASRISTFSAADKPVIFWTADHGAFVVRGAMKAAWDKLKGPNGKLGVPVGDQATDGDVISQKFTGGKISWNRTKNTFSTDPANLAPLLSGLQVSGQNQPSSAATPPHPKKFTWHWWWLAAGIGGLLLIVMLLVGAFMWRRRHTRPRGATLAHSPDVDDGYDGDIGYETPVEGQWHRDDVDLDPHHVPHGDVQPPERPAPDGGPAPKMSWLSRSDAAGEEMRSAPDSGPFELDDEDPDAVDTNPIPIVSDAARSRHPGYTEGFSDSLEDFAEAPHAEVATPEAGTPDAGYPVAVSVDDGYRDGQDDEPAGSQGWYPEAGYAEAAYPEAGYPVAGHPEAGYPEARYAEAAYPEAGYRQAGYPQAASVEVPYPLSAYPEAAAEAGYLEGPEAPEALDAREVPEAPEAPKAPHAPHAPEALAAPAVPASHSGYGVRTGRHAAADAEAAREAREAHEANDARARDREFAEATRPPVAVGSKPGTRPTIHLPLDDPYQMPDGYPIKASARFGLYYTPASALYHDTLAELWLASEDVALANGFIKAD
jgi:uncharacterized protein with LGFP repeats